MKYIRKIRKSQHQFILIRSTLRPITHLTRTLILKYVIYIWRYINNKGAIRIY